MLNNEQAKALAEKVWPNAEIEYRSFAPEGRTHRIRPKASVVCVGDSWESSFLAAGVEVWIVGEVHVPTLEELAYDGFIDNGDKTWTYYRLIGSES